MEAENWRVVSEQSSMKKLRGLPKMVRSSLWFVFLCKVGCSDATDVKTLAALQDSVITVALMPNSTPGYPHIIQVTVGADPAECFALPSETRVTFNGLELSGTNSMFGRGGTCGFPFYQRELEELPTGSTNGIVKIDDGEVGAEVVIRDMIVPRSANLAGEAVLRWNEEVAIQLSPDDEEVGEAYASFYKDGDLQATPIFKASTSNYDIDLFYSDGILTFTLPPTGPTSTGVLVIDILLTEAEVIGCKGVDICEATVSSRRVIQAELRAAFPDPVSSSE